MLIKNHSKKGGFSLIELLVALGLFGIVAIMGISAVLIIIASNRTSESIGSVLSNLNLSLETMTRNIRVGSNYHCGDFAVQTPAQYPQTLQDCPVSGGITAGVNDNITFKSEDGTNWYTYFYNASDKSLHKAYNGVDQGPITASEVKIATTTFFVSGSVNQYQNPPNKTQPEVTIIIAGYIDNGSKGQVPFNVQSTVSQRVIQ